MCVTRESVKEFFNRPYALLKSEYVQEALERLRTSRANITKTTTALTGMPGGGGADRATQLARHIDTEDQAVAALAGVEQAKMDNLRLIQGADLTARQRLILRERFVRMRTCTRVAEETGISTRQLYRDEVAAFDRCAEYIMVQRPSYALDLLT